MEEKDELLKKKLEDLILIYTKTEIAAHFNMSRQGLYKMFKKYNVDYKSNRLSYVRKANYLRLNELADQLLKK